MVRNRLFGWIACITCCLLFCMEGYAKKIVKHVNDKAYVIDYSKNTVYNSSNSSFDAKEYEAYDPQRFEINNWQLVKEAIKSSLSREKLEEMSKKSFGLIIKCDYEGNIESVKLLFPKEIFLTIEEIDKIETNLKNRKFLITAHAEKEKDGIQLGIPCRIAAVLK